MSSRVGLREDQQIGHGLAVEIANWLRTDEGRFPRGPTAQPSSRRIDPRRANESDFVDICDLKAIRQAAESPASTAAD